MPAARPLNMSNVFAQAAESGQKLNYCKKRRTADLFGLLYGSSFCTFQFPPTWRRVYRC
jgi:hypothetical protein